MTAPDTPARTGRLSEILEAYKNGLHVSKGAVIHTSDKPFVRMDEAEAKQALTALLLEERINELEMVLGSEEEYDDMTTYVESRIAALRRMTEGGEGGERE